MKVWGGNQSIDSGIALPGVDVWVFSQPFKGSGQGGDIYYTSLCGKGMLSRFVVTDVSSHGGADPTTTSHAVPAHTGDV